LRARAARRVRFVLHQASVYLLDLWISFERCGTCWRLKARDRQKSKELLCSLFMFLLGQPEQIEAFRMATIENARRSAQEPGIARFDVIQRQDDRTRFVLIEVYRDADAPALISDGAL